MINKPMEENQNIVSSMLKRRESIFGDGDAISLEDSKIYPPVYRTNLETEIDLWTQQIKSVQQECNTLKSTFNPDAKITVNQNIFSKDELDFFDHSLYYEYFTKVDKFCNKIQCAREIHKQKTQVLRTSLNRVDKQLKSSCGDEH